MHPHLRFSRQQNVTSSAWRAFGGKLINYSKGAFLLWLLSEGSHCTHTWQIEDDVFFTGRWSHLFDAYAHHNTDLIALTSEIKPTANWPWEAHCYIEPAVPCRRDGQLLSVVWPLLRLSQRLAFELSRVLERGGNGFHEAILQPVCARANWCSHAPLGASDVGRLVAGHIGGVSKTQQTLEFLALNQSKGWRTNVSSEARQLGIPENRVWHPVKCEADERLGSKARRWAGVE